MTEKPVTYALHIRGEGGLGEIKYDLFDLNFIPHFQVGNHILMRAFDYQYERDDRGVVTEVLWDFLSDEKRTVIHQHVTLREESISETAERNLRKKE